VLPEEVKEARKRLKFIASRHENAVGNHEFEKARFYADEERTQREALAQLHLKHNIPERQIVAKEDIGEAMARWTGMPIEAVREVSRSSEIESQKPNTLPKKKMSPKKKPRKKKP
jgi:ATP-dependent Clp protease ATP-binding subunit ClpC